MSRNVTIRYERRILRMGKHMVSSDAQCPFYKGETRNVVYCEGVTEESSIHNAFPGNALVYKSNYCCGKWESCIIAKMLWKKYGE